ncbi:hypothetical protein [Mycolicibacterium frederiksbergense]|uniref:hypothetical protein n=1 Tax=Mycolicibacterium frederiksbergense TaxID=117567 RepID=UPI00399B4F0E
MVDGIASSVALSKDLPILDPGDDTLDGGADAPVCAAVIAADDPAGLVSCW